MEGRWAVTARPRLTDWVRVSLDGQTTVETANVYGSYSSCETNKSILKENKRKKKGKRQTL